MNTKLLTISLLLSFSLGAQAEIYRPEFKDVPRGKQMDLLKEGSTLQLNQESSVQVANPPSNMFLTFLVGGFQPSTLTMQSTQSVDYNFNHLLPLASLQFSDMPWRKNGQWGWAASLGYSYSQYQNEDNGQTALHVLPVALNVAYRMELKETQKLIPYAMVGPQFWTVFQRGLDQNNTSQNALFGAGTLGVAFNLNRLHILKSRNDTEVVLQYQRTFGPANNSADFSGNTIQLGGTLAL